MDDFRNYCKNRIKYGFFRFIFLLIFACIIFYLSSVLHLFSSLVYALETTTIYRNANATTQGFLYTTSSSSTGTIYNGSVNSVISDASYGITFFINKGTSIGKVYKIRLNFNDYDYLSSNTSQEVSVSNGDECSVVGYQNLNKGGSNNQSKTVEVMYTCTSPGSYVQFQFGNYIEGSGYKRITTINWRINNLQWENIDDEQAQNIINNQTQNTQNIINNNNQNTENIINNQNQNNQQLIESQQSCQLIDKNDGVINNKKLYDDGTETTDNSYTITDYYVLDNATVTVNSPYTFATYYHANICYYQSNKTLISCENLSNLTTLTIPNNAYYFRSSIYKTDNIPVLKYCKNGNQGITDSIGDLTDALTDDSPVDMSSLGNTTGWLPAGPIDSIINMPLNLMNNLLTALNKTCTPLSVPLPYVNTNMTIPCLNTIFGKINGVTNYWGWVGTICSVLILYNYFLALYKYYDDLTTLKANFMTDFGGAP